MLHLYLHQSLNSNSPTGSLTVQWERLVEVGSFCYCCFLLSSLLVFLSSSHSGRDRWTHPRPWYLVIASGSSIEVTFLLFSISDYFRIIQNISYYFILFQTVSDYFHILLHHFLFLISFTWLQYRWSKLHATKAKTTSTAGKSALEQGENN